jgi:hypothetical protein
MDTEDWKTLWLPIIFKCVDELHCYEEGKGAIGCENRADGNHAR